MIQQKRAIDGSGNTRLTLENAPSVHLDYLRIKITCRQEELEQVFSFIGHKYLSVEMDSPWTAGRGCPYYKSRIITPSGISGGFTIDSETGDVEMMVQFSGEYFSDVSMTDSWRLITGLYHRFSADCSRIDIAIDDPSYSLIPVDKMFQGWQDGNNFGFRKYKDSGSGLTPKDYVKTHYFGSRESGKMVRVYDHKRKCMRFEVEFKREYSRLLFLLLASIERNNDFTLSDGQRFEKDCISVYKNCATILGCSEKFSGYKLSFESLHACNGSFDLLLQKVLGGIAVSSIDFRNKSEQKDPSKASYRDTTRLDWYQEFMDKVGLEIRVKLPRKEGGIRKTMAWMGRNVSKTVCKVKKSLTPEEFVSWFNKLFSIGEDKLKYSDLKDIEYLRDNKDLLRLSNA